jgi:hypothetical protein
MVLKYGLLLCRGEDSIQMAHALFRRYVRGVQQLDVPGHEQSLLPSLKQIQGLVDAGAQMACFLRRQAPCASIVVGVGHVRHQLVCQLLRLEDVCLDMAHTRAEEGNPRGVLVSLCLVLLLELSLLLGKDVRFFGTKRVLGDIGGLKCFSGAGVEARHSQSSYLLQDEVRSSPGVGVLVLEGSS